MTIDKAMTTAVSRAVSSRLGQTDFLNSETVSRRKATGLTRPPAPGGAGLMLRAGLLAMRDYLTSRWEVWLRQREQYFRSSSRLGSLRRFLTVV